MPFLPAALSVTAITIAMSPFLPLVMNCLTPSRTYSSPSFTAVVRKPPASEPTWGSVRQNAPSRSPRASGLRKRSFCSSLANAIMIVFTGQLVTLMIVDVAPSPAAISSRISDTDR